MPVLCNVLGTDCKPKFCLCRGAAYCGFAGYIAQTTMNQWKYPGVPVRDYLKFALKGSRFARPVAERGTE